MVIEGPLILRKKWHEKTSEKMKEINNLSFLGKYKKILKIKETEVLSNLSR